MIYFLRNADKSAIKIGTTIQLSVRLKQLAVEHGDLEVLGVVDGSYDEEKTLHQRFANLRIVGEWFEPGDDLIGFIVTEGKPWNGIEETTLIRVSIEFAAAIRDAASFDKTSVANFATAHLLPVVEKQYRDAVMKAAKRMGGKDSS